MNYDNGSSGNTYAYSLPEAERLYKEAGFTPKQLRNDRARGLITMLKTDPKKNRKSLCGPDVHHAISLRQSPPTPQSMTFDCQGRERTLFSYADCVTMAKRIEAGESNAELIIKCRSRGKSLILEAITRPVSATWRTSDRRHVITGRIISCLRHEDYLDVKVDSLVKGTPQQ